MLISRFFALVALIPLPALAETPRVVTDILPVQSIAAAIMGDLGAPDLLLPPGADPHDFALRPSDAAMLSAAQVVIWVGPGLTPWLTDPLATLAPQASQIALTQSPDWPALPRRETGDNHDHDDHGDGPDPHGWLDPLVAAAWGQLIADALAQADPANTATYAANAAGFTTEMEALTATIIERMTGLTGTSYLLPHDGYQYFEARFGLPAAGFVTAVDGQAPGPASLAALRDRVATGDIACVLRDAETAQGWIDVVVGETTTATATIDGTGAQQSAGAAAYPALIITLADSIADCLTKGR